MEYILFYMVAAPVFASILYGGIVGLLIYSKLDKNKEFRSIYSGYGGPEFWADAKKINDPQLQKYIHTFEVVCPKLIIGGFVITVFFAITFFYFYG